MNQLTPNDKQAGIEHLTTWARADSKEERKEREEQIEAIKDLFKLDAPPDEAVVVIARAAGMVQSDPDAAWTVVEEHFAQQSSALLNAAFASQNIDYWGEPGPVIDWIVKDWLPGGRV